MKILMLAWECSRKNLTAISGQSYYLSTSLKNLGHEVHIITCSQEEELLEEDLGLFIHKVIPYNISTEDFIKKIMHYNFSMIELAVKLISKVGKFDIIHACDWRTAYTAKLLKGTYNMPMICTMHDTEHGRNGRIITEIQSYISSVEWMLTYESWKIITCTNYMKQEINKVFSVPLDKIYVIPSEISSENTWNIIADNTIKVYDKVKEEASGTEWELMKEKQKKKSNTSIRKKKIVEVKEELEEKVKAKPRKTIKTSGNKANN